MESAAKRPGVGAQVVSFSKAVFPLLLDSQITLELSFVGSFILENRSQQGFMTRYVERKSGLCARQV